MSTGQLPRFATKECTTGLMEFIGQKPQPSIARILEKLLHSCPAVLIADPGKSKDPILCDLETGHLVCNWIKTAAGPRAFALPNENFDLESVIENHWDQGRLLFVFTRIPIDQFMDQLRILVSQREPGDDRPVRNIIGYCWPDALASILETGDDELSKPFIKLMDMVFLEGKKPKLWRAYSQPEFKGILEKLKFECVN